MDGTIVKYDPKKATGIIRTKDGKEFLFRKADWRESRAPRRNDRVDFEAGGDKAKDVYFFQEEDKAAPPPQKPAPVKFDIGLAAGGYAIVFFSAAIFDMIFHAIDLDANDIIGLLVVLDLFTIAAWIWGTQYKLMRGIATLFAALTTLMVALLVARHMLQ
jgi:hypothetical protein